MEDKNRTKEVPLVLSSGGARGMGHIGAIEDLPIPYCAVADDLYSGELTKI